MEAYRLISDPFYWWLAVVFLYSELVIVVVLITIEVVEQLADMFSTWPAG